MLRHLGCVWILLILLKTENNKKIIFRLLFTPKHCSFANLHKKKKKKKGDPNAHLTLFLNVIPQIVWIHLDWIV